jgi:hypothetical protein
MGRPFRSLRVLTRHNASPGKTDFGNYGHRGYCKGGLRQKEEPHGGSQRKGG